MARGGLTVTIPNQRQVRKQLGRIPVDADKIIQTTLRDAHRRAPGWVSVGLTSTFKVSSADTKESRQVKIRKVTKRKETRIEYRSWTQDLAATKALGLRVAARASKARGIVSGQATAKLLKTGTTMFTPKSFFLPDSKRGPMLLTPTGSKRKGKRTHRRWGLSVSHMMNMRRGREAIQKQMDQALAKRFENHIKQAKKRAGYLQ